MKRREFLAGGAGLLVVGTMARAGRGPETAQQADALATKAAEFLRPRQDKDGAWSAARNGPGITALVATGLLRSRRALPADPAIVKALAYLETKVGPNGGFEEGGQANYVTSIALMAFHEVNSGGKYDGLIAAGQKFLKDLQWGESKGKGPESNYYGGAGYRGDQSRPDLSNTAFMMDALRDTGLPADDPNLQRALTFVSRCQNLKTEFNDQPWAGLVNDGGFVYTAANQGESKAGGEPGKAMPSYGGMTYAGLKSMIHAGLSKDDPRMQGALRYIRANYSVEENPGMGQVGLYYYYHTFAKALTLFGEDPLVDAKGTTHDWRADLVGALAKRQGADGSWVNTADRFMEGDANLVTAYGLLALGHLRKPA